MSCSDATHVKTEYLGNQEFPDEWSLKEQRSIQKKVNFDPTKPIQLFRIITGLNVTVHLGEIFELKRCGCAPNMGLMYP